MTRYYNSISDDLRAVAFQKAIELLSQDSGVKGKALPTTSAQRQGALPGGAESGTEKISRKLGLSPDAVGESIQTTTRAAWM